MKMMRLDDIFPTVYHLLHSEKGFRKNHENTLAATVVRRTVFKLLLNREEYRKVFNMAKLRLIHSFSMIYYTPRSDKQLKNQSENSTKKHCVQFFPIRSSLVCIVVLLLQKMQCSRIERAVCKCYQNNYSANISRIVIPITLPHCTLNARALHFLQQEHCNTDQ